MGIKTIVWHFETHPLRHTHGTSSKEFISIEPFKKLGAELIRTTVVFEEADPFDHDASKFHFSLPKLDNAPESEAIIGVYRWVGYVADGGTSSMGVKIWGPAVIALLDGDLRGDNHSVWGLMCFCWSYIVCIGALHIEH